MSDILVQILTERSEFPLQSATDYRQYRVRVSRQLSRTRKALGVQTKPGRAGKGPTAAEKSTEPRHRIPFVPPTSSDVESKPELLRVLVCLAERSWASAMETNSVLDTNYSKSKKAHVRSKLAKAVKYIDTATFINHQIADSTGNKEFFTPTQQLQLETYSLLLHGALAFQTKNFKKCVTDYSLARIALESFASTSNDSVIKDNVQDLISTVIDPSLVYAHYRLYKVRPLSTASLAVKVAKDAWESPVIDSIKKIDPAALDASLAEASANNRLDVIKWRSREAAIEDRELAATLFKAVSQDEKLDKELESSRSKNSSSSSVDASMSLFDTVLQAWQDAHDMVRANIDRLESSGKATHDQQVQDQYVVATYVGYHMLLRRIQRDTILLDRVESKIASTKLSLEKTQEVVRLYDTVLQSTNQLINLSGVHTDQQLAASLAALDAFYKAKRLLVLGAAYKHAHQLPEAFALYNKASQSLQTAAPGKIEAELPYGILDDKRYRQEVAEAKAKALQLRAQLTLGKSSKPSKDSDSMDVDEEDDDSNTGKVAASLPSAVVDNLDQYALSVQSAQQVSENLVSLRAEQKAAFAKPVFFDIAFNYIGQEAQDSVPQSSAASATSMASTPSHQEKAGSSESYDNNEEPVEEKKKGGFFKLWGR